MIRHSAIALLVATCAAAGLRAQETPPGPPPQDASFFQGQAMRALNEKVDILLDQKRTDLAIQELRRVYGFDVPKTQPSYEMKVRLVGRLAGLYAATGKKAEALETVKGMLADVTAGTPAEAAAWLEAGTAYRALAMPDDALKALDRAIELSQKLAQTGWRPPRREGGRGRPEGAPGQRPPGAPPDGTGAEPPPRP